MDDDLDQLEEAIGYLARAMSKQRFWHSVQHSARVNIDRPSAHLLGLLSRHANDWKLHDLAAKIGVEAPSITRTVQRLEQERLIVRLIDRTDRRAGHIQITAHGLRTLRGLRRAKRDYFKSLFDSWSVKDRQQLIKLLHRLALEAAAKTETIPTPESISETKA
jgi:DNA-binding MarR family transcriptional regulator